MLLHSQTATMTDNQNRETHLNVITCMTQRHGGGEAADACTDDDSFEGHGPESIAFVVTRRSRGLAMGVEVHEGK